VNPPDQVLVVAVDETSQIQALERIEPILPLRPGLPERQTYDSRRHGATTRFAALHGLTDKVTATGLPRHRRTELPAFLEKTERQTPEGLAGHLILDTQGAHTQPPNRAGAGSPSPLSVPLHAQRRRLAQPGGALLGRADAQADPAGQLSRRARAGTGHPRVSGRAQPARPSFCLDPLGFPDHPQRPAL